MQPKFVVLKREAFIYHSFYIPTLGCGDELGTENVGSQLGTAKMSWGGGRMRRLDIQKELRVQSLLLDVERSQLRCIGHLIRIPPGGLPLEVLWQVQCGGDPGANPEHARGTIYVPSGL